VSAKRVLHRDYETRSVLDLPTVGVHRYAADSHTKISCVAYAVDDAPVQLWLPGDLVPPEFIEAARGPTWLAVAHNDAFESAIERHILVPRYGFPEIPLERHRCTMAAALALALPAELALLAKVLCLKYQKDAAGKHVMLQMSRPRRARTGEDPNRIYWHNDPELFAQLCAYCRQDVEVERELYNLLPPLVEQSLWELDQRINQRGFFVDTELARAARELARRERAAINAEIAALTDGKITTAGQVAKITDFVHERGHQLVGLTKRSVSAVLARGEPDEDVRRLLELRREGAHASVHKLDALLTSVDADGRMRGTLRYHAAATGRWSGRGFQPQNLKRPETEDITGAVAAVLAGDLDGVRELGSPLGVVGDVMRSMICAAPGHVLIAGDFSAIESRVLAWLAGEAWKLDGYRAFDRTADPALEPYCVTASRILRRTVTPDDEAGRHIGKTADLALGFGGALGAWRRFDADEHTDQEINGFVQRWRQAHPATVRFWRRLESAAKRAIRTAERGTLGDLAFEFESGTFRIVLPSGRAISYPKAQIVPGKFAGTTQIAFKDNARGGWNDVTAWYGTLVENVVQGTARDLLATAMQRVERAGFPVVLHVHDEIVCEAPGDRADAAEFHRLMVEPPSWTAGLPIAAKVRAGERYSKSKTEPQSEAPATANIDESERVYADDF
jgi:DNA polymerase bacteriophage-type